VDVRLLNFHESDEFVIHGKMQPLNNSCEPSLSMKDHLDILLPDYANLCLSEPDSCKLIKNK